MASDRLVPDGSSRLRFVNPGHLEEMDDGDPWVSARLYADQVVGGYRSSGQWSGELQDFVGS